MSSAHNSSTSMKPFTANSPNMRKLLILLAILAAALPIFSALHTNETPLHPPLYNTLSKTRCVIYDRPLRTGSNTISRTLTNCLEQKRYTVLRWKNMNQNDSVVTAMLSLDNHRIAMVRNHISISDHDVTLLRERCANLLYITSAAPMKERLYSALKYALTAGQLGHGNSTIETDMVTVAENKADKSALREVFLEAYPYNTNRSLPIKPTSDRMVPDFVVNKHSLPQQMKAMLSALNCNTTIRTSNVHSANTEDSRVLAAIKLDYGDAVYKWLMKVAKNNQRGLKKAREF